MNVKRAVFASCGALLLVLLLACWAGRSFIKTCHCEEVMINNGVKTEPTNLEGGMHHMAVYTVHIRTCMYIYMFIHQECIIICMLLLQILMYSRLLMIITT